MKIKNFENFKLNEFYNSSSLSEDEMMEMANVYSEDTGIKNVVIWVGPNPGQHWKRIKISNIPNKWGDSNCFTLTIPDFKIIGNVNTKLITKDVLEDIKNWININIEPINDYSNRTIFTSEFLKRLKSIKDI